MDFGELSQKVFSSYGRGSFSEALDLVQEEYSRFPEHDSTLTFWEACLLSLTGDPQAALEILESGLERGLGWHPKMLADPDLNAARQLEGWGQLEERSAAQVADLAGRRPDPLVREARDPAGTLVTLHGAGSFPKEFFVRWVEATPVHWTVIAPVGEVLLSTDGRWAWPYDLSTDSLVEALADRSMTEPLVLAGFSQGARMAAKAAWDGLIEASGLIVCAGALSVEGWQQSNRNAVPLYAVVGTEDLAYQPSLDLAAVLEEKGVPVRLDVREGVGHVLPDDLDAVVESGLHWLDLG